MADQEFNAEDAEDAERSGAWLATHSMPSTSLATLKFMRRPSDGLGNRESALMGSDFMGRCFALFASFAFRFRWIGRSLEETEGLGI